MSKVICSCCKDRESEHTGKIECEGDVVSLCWSCMSEKELAWNDDGYFCSDNETCHMCGGRATWCSCCQTYSSNCCQDYGTCQCS